MDPTTNRTEQQKTTAMRRRHMIHMGVKERRLNEAVGAALGDEQTKTAERANRHTKGGSQIGRGAAIHGQAGSITPSCCRMRSGGALGGR
jgi:hypothetical protein